MRPALIADAVAAKVTKVRERYGSDVGIFVGYADCGTNGTLDAYLEREGISRIDGAHCFEFYAGTSAYAALQEEELGTFYLTDFLARQFDSIIYAGLGLDRHPELLPALLRQLPPARLSRPVRRPRPDGLRQGRRRQARTRLRTSRDRVRRPRRHPSAPPQEPPDMPHALDHLVARHPRPGRRQGRPSVEQGRPSPALPGRDRQGRQPGRQARLQQLHRRMAQDPSTLQRRPRGRRQGRGRAP